MAHLEEIVVGGTLTEVEKLDHSAQQVDDAIDRIGQVPNPNLLINADFRRTVNRNGKSEYSAPNGYTIDRWECQASKLEIGNGFLTLSGKTSGANFLQQTIEATAAPSGKVCTVSFLLIEGLITGTGIFPNKGDGQKSLAAFNGWNIVARWDENHDNPSVYIRKDFTDDIIHPIAAKLELGSAQTLARQNEDGEWELLEAPDYDLQYLLCSQYSPITGEWVGSQHSNPNLLDNWYFAKKGCIINQRGQDVYTFSETKKEYFIDRWWKYVAGTATLTEQGIELTPGMSIYQNVNPEAAIAITGEQITISCLYLDSNGISKLTAATGIFGDQSINGPNITCESAVTSSSFGGVYAAFGGLPEAATVQAMKLELGPVQTLAHKEGDTWVLNDPPPDKALELAKCQRYFQVIDGIQTEGYNPSAGVRRTRFILPAPMRAYPSVVVETSYFTNNCALSDIGAVSDTVLNATLNVEAAGVYNWCAKIAVSADL